MAASVAYPNLVRRICYSNPMEPRLRVALFLLVGCTSSDPITLTGVSPKRPVDPALEMDASSAPQDAGADSEPRPTDAGTKEAGYPHRYGDGGANAVCDFNRDCAQGLRCECAGTCACKPGKRGEGKLGESCQDAGGEGCGSSICIDDKTCSEECGLPSECAPHFPRCLQGPLSSGFCSP